MLISSVFNLNNVCYTTNTFILSFASIYLLILEFAHFCDTNLYRHTTHLVNINWISHFKILINTFFSHHIGSKQHKYLFYPQIILVFCFRLYIVIQCIRLKISIHHVKNTIQCRTCLLWCCFLAKIIVNFSISISSS